MGDLLATVTLEPFLVLADLTLQLVDQFVDRFADGRSLHLEIKFLPVRDEGDIRLVIQLFLFEEDMKLQNVVVEKADFPELFLNGVFQTV